MNPKDECKVASQELQAMVVTPGWARFQTMLREDIQVQEDAIEDLLDKDPSIKNLQTHFAIRKAGKRYLDWVQDQIRRGGD